MRRAEQPDRLALPSAVIDDVEKLRREFLTAISWRDVDFNGPSGNVRDSLSIIRIRKGQNICIAQTFLAG